MAERIPPDEERLKRLIHEAHEFLPGPDMARLQALEERLKRKAHQPARSSPSRTPWWVVLLLVGGAATAAWWTGYMEEGERAGTPSQSTPWAGTKPAYNQKETRERETQDNQADVPLKESRSPVIYRREDN